MKTSGPVCLSQPEGGLCWSRRLDNRPDGWIPYAGPDTQARLLGTDPEAEAG
jgi:hypothetical protein